MPWLTGTALIHSLAVTEKRGTFRSWTVLLAIVAFALSLLGTFLVRSGVLTSVHAFATDPARGIFILVFLTLVVGGSLTLYAARAGAVGSGGDFQPLSRESFLLANNILLGVAMATVLIGTLFPLIVSALDVGKVSVGPPYFNLMFPVFMGPLVFLMGIGPIAAWRHAPLPGLWTRLRWALGVAIVIAALLPFVLGTWKPLVAVGLFLSLWVVGASIVTVTQRFAGMPQRGLVARLRGNSAAWYGMLVAHLGVAIFIVGVTLVRGYEIERDVRLAPGESVEVGGYTFTFRGITPSRGPNYDALVGSFDVRRGERALEPLKPEKRSYRASGQVMTEAAIDPGLTGDRYVSLGEPVTDAGPDGAWAVRIYVKPFVDWIWGGCFVMALGGLLAISDRRYRVAVRRRAESAAVAAAAD
jgi:cytochrome c-type biogenesis protein CcmF